MREKLLLSLMATAIALAPQTQGASAQGANAGLEEIVVTARKREESLQQVPLAVTALGAQELAISGVSNLADIQAQVPGLTAYAARGTSSTLTTYIRGVGQSDPLFGVEPGVGLYIDDVYLARPQGALLEVFDVARVEVLRGPQGTLYGRNTIGGAIKYVSAPVSEVSEGEVDIATGSYGRRDIKASYSTPLIEDVLYSRVAFASLYRDGFGENRSTGEDLSDKQIITGRVALQWNISSDFTANFSADGTQDTSAPRGGQRLLENSFEPILNAIASDTVADLSAVSPLLAGVYPAQEIFAASVNFPALPVSSDRYDLDNGFANQKNNTNNSGASLTLSYDINDAWQVKSITAYRESDTESAIDFDTGPLPIADVNVEYFDHQLSQEFQLNYEAEHLQAVIGLYYLDGTAGASTFSRFLLPVPVAAGVAPNPLPIDVITTAGVFSTAGGEVVTQSYSLYGEASYQISDQLSLSLGGRFNWENKQVDLLAQNFASDQFVNVVATETDFNDDEDWQNFSPRIGLDYQISEDTLLYSSISRGYKSGGYNVRAQQTQVPESTRPYDEEIVTAYELGFKAQPFSNLTLNASYFYSDYEDVQLSIFSSTSDGRFFGDFTNAGKGVIQGVEIEYWLAVNEQFSLSGNFAYLDAEYKEFIDGGIDVADQQEFTNTPDFTATVNATYRHDFTGGAELIARLSYSYRDDVIPTTDLSELVAQNSYHTIDASLTLFTADEHWRFVLQGRNLSDEEYRTTGYDLQGSGFPIAQGFYGDPRTVAFKASYSF